MSVKMNAKCMKQTVICQAQSMYEQYSVCVTGVLELTYYSIWDQREIGYLRRCSEHRKQNLKLQF